ncbi:MAG TPA: family 43 glycosylhydrolase, partial [Hanamia sp.]|nr:family 43 glycosylhydrolase [Hanamia sp.]
IKNVHGIDPNVFIDKDGQAYLYWAQGNIYGAKLKDNMLELASEPKVLGTLPDKGLKEGPYLFERNGIYYLTYPHVADKTERLEYAISDNPLGPFKVTGVIMDASPECWTNHQSVIEFKNQWYLFYHHDDYSPQFDKARSIRVDSLFFNKDGTIRKVIPTFRGVGLTNPTQEIQIDRYTAIANEGISINFIDTANTFRGWKTVFSKPSAWIQYNSVDFGKKPLKNITVRALSAMGGTLQVHINSIDGPILAEIKIPKSTDWKNVKTKVRKFIPGVHNLFVRLKDNSNVEVDWLSFE